MEADYVIDELIEDANDDAAWIFDTYHEDGDDKRPCNSNYVRRRLRLIAARHRSMAQQLKELRRGT